VNLAAAAPLGGRLERGVPAVALEELLRLASELLLLRVGGRRLVPSGDVARELDDLLLRKRRLAPPRVHAEQRDGDLVAAHAAVAH
jgi:hypothetical protein